MRQLSLILFLSVLAFMGPTSVRADILEAADVSHSRIELFSETPHAKPDANLWFAVRISPREGWHAYWKNAGNSGAAPIFDWFMTSGEAGDPHFPVPRRLPVGPLMNYGYNGDVLFLFEHRAPSSGALEGTLEAEWLVCEVECVPQLATFDFAVPVNNIVEPEIDSRMAALFAKARESLPEPSFWDAALAVSDTASHLTVFMDETEAEKVETAYFFPAGIGVADYAAEQTVSTSEAGLLLTISRPSGSPDVTNAEGVLVMSFGEGNHAGFALKPSLTVKQPVGGSDSPSLRVADLPIWQAFLFALVGGLILNLMPCVFPILSLKAFAFVSANYKTDANRRMEGWAYTLGIWLSFMAIVSVLLAIRTGGAAVGWGFQLQEPLFVGALALVMLLVALSLSGMFAIQTGVEGAGQALASREGAKGAFFKGVLATLVATPCTAPFMAPAIGYALTQPSIIVLLIFSGLAFGLALPFLLLSHSPALARLMPRPGPWMEKVKEALAFPLYLTAVWLVYVFDREAGAAATFVLMAAMVSVVFCIWLWQQGAGVMLRSAAIIIGLGSIVIVAMKPWDISADEQHGRVAEVEYSAQSLDRMLAEQRSVFVYFTADWCITCKVNERLAILTDGTQAAFQETDTVVMKGDWTNRNSEIASVLASHGRAGVPLYLYYPAGHSTPIVLPEILGPNTVSNLLKETMSN